MNCLSVFITKCIGRKFRKFLSYQRVTPLDSSTALKSYKKIAQFCIQNKITLTPTIGYSNFAARSGISNPKYMIHFSLFQNNNLIIPTLLHELGHIILWKNGLDHLQIRLARKLLSVGHPLYLSEKNLIVLEEQGAWDVAEVIAKELKIDLGPWFYEVQEIAMRTYMALEPIEKIMERLAISSGR